MSDKNCGHCDYQGGGDQKRIECRVDNEWHEIGYSCDDFKVFVPSKTQEERRAEAYAVGRRKEAKDAEQSRKEFEEKMAEKDRVHAEELQRVRMEFDDKLAQKDREHAAELVQKELRQEKKLWKASWWWHLILIAVSATLGFLASWLLNN